MDTNIKPSVAATGEQGRTSPTAPRLVMGQIALSFHRVAAAAVKLVLEAHGHMVEVREAAHEDLFAQLACGELDLLVSAWLPHSHGAYCAPLKTAVLPLTVLYEPYCIWGVPEYVPAQEVASVMDLLAPTVRARMTSELVGIGPGAGITRFSIEMMSHYRLTQAGYTFTPSSPAACIAAFEAAVAERRWVVVPLWVPHYLHRRHRIRALHEPLGLLREPDAATLLLRCASADKLLPEARHALEQLYLGNGQVTEMDDLINTHGYTPHAAAQQMLPHLSHHAVRAAD